MRNTSPTLLFDLGGILVDIDFSRVLDSWAPHSSLPPDELKRRFGFDEAYERHERGELDAAGYFAHVAHSLSLWATHQEIEAGWNAVFVGEFGETRALVESLRGSVPLFAFTNTNASHMAFWSRRFPWVEASFERVFASHELGLRKPDRAAFDHVVREIGVPAKEILFLDDTLVNVEGARAAGLQAEWVRTPAEVREAVQRAGLPALHQAAY